MARLDYNIAMARELKTTGIVIGKRDLGEADRSFVVFSPDLGKVQCRARGVRKAGAKLSAWMDMLRYNDLVLIEGRAGHLITGAQTKQALFTGEEEWSTLAVAYYVCEVIDKLFEERVVVAGVFELLLATLTKLKDTDQPFEVRAGFELKLLELLGLAPQLHNCAGSGKQLVANESLYFSLRLGGVIQDMGKVDDFAVPINTNVVKLMRLWQQYSFDATEGVAAETGDVAVATALVSDFMAFALDSRSKALAALG